MKFTTSWLVWNEHSGETIHRFQKVVDASTEPLESIVECLAEQHKRVWPAKHIGVRCTGAAPV